MGNNKKGFMSSSKGKKRKINSYLFLVSVMLIITVIFAQKTPKNALKADIVESGRNRLKHVEIIQ